MVKKKNKKAKKKVPRKVKKKGTAAKAKSLPLSIKKKSIGMMEDETLKKAERMLSLIDRFMKRWENAEEQPEGMEAEVKRVREYHDILGKWYKKAQKAHNSKASEASRVKILREFITICVTYS